MKCEICGAEDDLFSAVRQEAACSICVLRFGLMTPVRSEVVVRLRERLKLGSDEYLAVQAIGVDFIQSLDKLAHPAIGSR